MGVDFFKNNNPKTAWIFLVVRNELFPSALFASSHPPHLPLCLLQGPMSRLLLLPWNRFTRLCLKAGKKFYNSSLNWLESLTEHLLKPAAHWTQKENWTNSN